ncbi:nuclear transport factor 2 family protein [Streptomyces sp. P9(2023)]|uniref:nuclear transport factor 2 family protein n=1 Tax=Streptomyces sp. P9(2023) TaxID=3064394 RepID=UPI0028F43BD8|nr:nuclear transport factor 2 family protein [Streptomyces sp. P9(2023)]MDT9691806.1 nuclear transport factor 2 family protein [Streptomyces sp. P9(2023)]
MAMHPDAALVRQGYEAFGKGDLATLAELMTADCTHHSPGESQVSGHFKGRENILAMFQQLFDLSHGTMRVELDGVYPDGRGHVISTHKTFAERGDRGIEMRGGLFFTIIGGKISDVDECVEDIDESDAFWGQPE